MQEREKQRQEAKDKGLDVVPSNLCCKCAEKKKKRPQGMVYLIELKVSFQN